MHLFVSDSHTLGRENDERPPTSRMDGWMDVLNGISRNLRSSRSVAFTGSYSTEMDRCVVLRRPSSNAHRPTNTRTEPKGGLVQIQRRRTRRDVSTGGVSTHLFECCLTTEEEEEEEDASACVRAFDDDETTFVRTSRVVACAPASRPRVSSSPVSVSAPSR